MGNTNEKYIKDLSLDRPVLENVLERAICFKFQVDRQQISEEDRGIIKESLQKGDTTLSDLLNSQNYRIRPAERESIRVIKQELAVLKGAIEDFPLDAVTTESARLIDQRISGASDNLKQFLQWMDTKLEKKWWLSETIKYIRTLMKIATFLSASLSVAYPNMFGPIVTLIFTVISGVIDIIDQVFVKGLRPSAVRTLTSIKAHTHS